MKQTVSTRVLTVWQYVVCNLQYIYDEKINVRKYKLKNRGGSHKVLLFSVVKN